MSKRLCRSCGAQLQETDVLVCQGCAECGLGRGIFDYRMIRHEDVEDAFAAMGARAEAGMAVDQGVDDVVINAVAKGVYKGTAFGSYGRFRAYVRDTGKLPPRGCGG